MKAYRVLLREYLSDFIRDLRMNRKLTQQELAEELRITTRAYGDLERGKYCVSSISLLFLFYLLDPDDLRVVLEDFIKKVHIIENKEVT